MPDYGLTPQGPNIKRLDTIIDEMHDDLSDKWGINTRKNTQSFINHLITNVADRLAELWEFAEAVYYSQYPSSAEGRSLDNAAQFGGSTRKTAAKSIYPIHCTGVDGTVLAEGTMVATTMNPVTYLSLTEERKITRQSFNKAVVKVVTASPGSTYQLTIDGITYSFTANSSSAKDILSGLANQMPSNEDNTKFTKAVDTTAETLTIELKDTSSSSSMDLSERLTTESVTSIINFRTVDTGDISLPDGSITEITKADSGLFSVTNLSGYVAGNNEETDTEFRQSYIDKIFNRSSMMLESIRSAILNNVQGVESVAVYENDTNSTDAAGRPPHSIEVIVDGGNTNEIAQEILNNKAGGIATYGSQSVTLNTAYDDSITINFSRPSYLYVWFKITAMQTEGVTPPENWRTLIKNVVLEKIKDLNTGDDVIPQQFISDMFKAVPIGISYIDIAIYSTTEQLSEFTGEYTDRVASVTARQRSFVNERMIIVDFPTEEDNNG